MVMSNLPNLFFTMNVNMSFHRRILKLQRSEYDQEIYTTIIHTADQHTTPITELFKTINLK